MKASNRIKEESNLRDRNYSRHAHRERKIFPLKQVLNLTSRARETGRIIQL